MFQSTLFALGLAPMTVAQAFVSSDEGALIFSGPKFLVTLLAGVLMAFAFQLLLTNFSVALGISAAGDLGDDDDDVDTVGGKIRRVETKVGTWALVTSSIALSIASFLAVKLSLIGSTFFGAILGIVIWSTYFLVVMWLGSKAVGSLIGSLVSTATAGLQGIMGTATAGLGANLAKQQTISTAEEITAAVRRELTSGFDADSIKNTLQGSLSSLQLPKLDLEEIGSQFDSLLKDVDFESIADSDLLKNIDRQTLVDLISSRTDLSKEEVNNIADRLEGSLKQAIKRQNPTEQVLNLLQQSTPEELNSENLSERLQQLVTVGGGNGKQGNGNGLMKQAVQYGMGAAATAVLNKVDLKDVDVDKVTQQLQKLKENVRDVDVEKIVSQLKQLTDKTSTQIAQQVPGLPNPTIKSDVEDYIKNSFLWHLNRITIQEEFKNIIYDADADPRSVRRQLEEFNTEYFANLLKQRGDLDEAKVKEISDQLESIRTEVLGTVRQR
jgi:hypothetical protein